MTVLQCADVWCRRHSGLPPPIVALHCRMNGREQRLTNAASPSLWVVASAVGGPVRARPPTGRQMPRPKPTSCELGDSGMPISSCLWHGIKRTAPVSLGWC